jgi:hypothetical protein
MLQRARDNMALYEPNLRYIERCAGERVRFLRGALETEPSSDLGAESLHIWHLQRREREAEIKSYEAIQDDARFNILLLEDDWKNAQGLVGLTRHGEASFPAGNKKERDSRSRFHCESHISRQSMTPAVPNHDRTGSAERMVPNESSHNPLSSDARILALAQRIQKAKEAFRYAEKALHDHAGTYNEEFAKYLNDIRSDLIERHGKSSPKVQNFAARRGHWSDSKIAERFAPIFLARGREKTQKLALADQELDTAMVHAAGLGVLTRPEQAIMFESESQDSVNGQY